jgi:hypothetical protein
MDLVSNVPDGNLINRLSPMQWAILDAFPLDDGTHATVMVTGEVIDKIGRKRERTAYASVSRSLDRLVKVGLLQLWAAQVSRQGKGYLYTLTNEGARLRKAAAEKPKGRKA